MAVGVAGGLAVRAADGRDGGAAAGDRVLAQRLRDGGARAAGAGAAARRAGRAARPRSCGWCVASGVVLAVHFATWVTSLTLTSVASATALVCLQIAWVVAWQLLRGERFSRRRRWLGLVLAFAGVLVVSGVDFTSRPRRWSVTCSRSSAGRRRGVHVIGSRARQAVSARRRTRSSATAPAPLSCWSACLVVGPGPGRLPADAVGAAAAGHRDRAADGALGVQPPAGHHLARCSCRWRCCSRCPAPRCWPRCSSARRRRSAAFVGLVVILRRHGAA